MNIINKIDEAIKKLSFEEFINSKKNKRMVKKIYDRYYEDYAMEYGQQSIDDPQLYGSYADENGDFDFEVDQIEAYEDFAHAMGHIAEYSAAESTISDLKRKFDYKRGDETDEEKQEMLFKVLGVDWMF
jgi:hypothetical protein